MAGLEDVSVAVELRGLPEDMTWTLVSALPGGTDMRMEATEGRPGPRWYRVSTESLTLQQWLKVLDALVAAHGVDESVPIRKEDL